MPGIWFILSKYLLNESHLGSKQLIWSIWLFQLLCSTQLHDLSLPKPLLTNDSCMPFSMPSIALLPWLVEHFCDYVLLNFCSRVYVTNRGLAPYLFSILLPLPVHCPLLPSV